MKTLEVIEQNGKQVVVLDQQDKPTWLSTEFWLRTIQVLSGLAISTGLFDPGEVQLASDYTTQLVGPIMQLLGIFLLGNGAGGYNKGRVQIKTKP
jgi:hypothetical protein